ncbi:MAG: acetate--CoA ligase family protein [Parvibaculaceae bacterium]|nr:acetate--CoA ligase family protein [Parvibaculaceae bacterium]
MDELPAPPEHVVFALADSRMEASFDDALRVGAKAATILSPLMIEGETGSLLKDRVRDKANAAGMVLCGANCMGFYNFLDGVRLCGFETRENLRPGPIALMTHSGSIFGALIDCEERLDFSIAVSSGQELNVTLADYIDYALTRPETRVIGLFMEAARDGAGFRKALAKAAARNIPVVALKVGRTGKSAELAVSHSGALVGDDGAYEAVFDAYGVHRVHSVEELAFTLMMFAQGREAAAGGLVSIHDSGGERGLMLDLADDANVPFAELAPETLQMLADTLDPGLPPVNPLDAWGTGHDYERIFSDCFSAMMHDPATALGAVVVDRAMKGAVPYQYSNILYGHAAESGKPMFLVSNHQGSGESTDAVRLTRDGYPVIDSVPGFLRGARALLDHRDRQSRPAGTPPQPPARAVADWTERLKTPAPFDEAEGLALLDSFSVPVVASRKARTVPEVLDAASRLGYPLVLKTAMPGIAHKSDVGGVRVGIDNEAALLDAYADMSARLGPLVLLAPMVGGPKVEMLLGMVADAQFGPIVTIAMGGVHAELLHDRVTALPPFSSGEALRLIGKLKLRKLLDGLRGEPALDIAALCEAASNFSVLAAALGGTGPGQIAAIDVNPVIVRPSGVVAVDALVEIARPSE